MIGTVLIAIILVTGLAFLGISTVTYFVDHRESTIYYPRWTRMKWKVIKQLYPIEPDRWKFNGGDLTYDVSRTDTVAILVSYPTFLRLCWGLLQVNKRKKNARNNEALKLVLETAQEDINRLRQEASRDITTGTEEWVKAVKRMGRS